MKSAKADLALIGVTAIWGCTFLLVQNALADVSPVLFLALRFAVASAALFVVYRKRLMPAAVMPGIGAGIFLFAGYAFQTVGLKYTTASKSAFLTSLSVPLVPLAGSLVYRLVPKPFELLGVLMASVGMVLLTAPTSFSGISRGDWLSFLCAVSFAGQVVAVSHSAGKGNFETLALVQMVTASVLALAAFSWIETPVLRFTPRVIGAAILTGLLASALAFSVQAWAQQFTSVTRAAIIYALEPVFAWITSWWLLGESLGLRGSAGAALILLGILTVELKRGLTAGHPTAEPGSGIV
jgi:drug/metabolite transporter (DMT)-like permease